MKDIYKLYNPFFVLWLIFRYHPFAPIEYYLKWKGWNKLSISEKAEKNWNTFDSYLYYNPMICGQLIFWILCFICFVLTAMSYFGWMFLSNPKTWMVVTSFGVGLIFHGLTVLFYEKIKIENG